ncbi:MAG: hypothetical protein OIN87_03680 [Candidatus Methanoperedens sp.]|nr:hypothetical protein [Candidatus Methanoperedens sp.]
MVMIRSEKGQLYTMEAVASALLLVLVVIFILKAAPMTPNSSFSSTQQSESALITRGHDLLTVLDYIPEDGMNSELKDAIASWNGVQYSGQSPLPAGPTNITANDLKEVLGDAGIVYNLEVYYNTSTGISLKPILWNGKPSDNAVIVSRSIVFYDDDLNWDHKLIITENDPGITDIWNIVEVRLTLWRM